jgi:hypothetical protein
MHDTNDPEFQRNLDRLRALPESEKRAAQIRLYSDSEDVSWQHER